MRLAALLALAALTAPPARADVLGRASVTDGDTLEIAGERVCLFDVDAPESRQICEREGASYRCGQRVALALADRLGAGNVRCEERDTDRYGRTIAVCYLGGDDVNAWLAREGWAGAYRQYSRDYVDEEAEEGRAARPVGGHVPDAGRPAAGAATRRVGGLGPDDLGRRRPAVRRVLDQGQHLQGRVYHAPGTRAYDGVEMNAARGERWFCSEAEARVAGWRPSSY